MYPANQSFLVLGLSRSGRAAAEFLLSKNAEVYLYDDMETERVEKELDRLSAQGGKRVDKEALAQMPEKCDVLVLSPGIPIDHPLAVAFRRNRRAVIGESELAARFIRCPIIAVTGTNGKTTTVSMLAEVLQNSGFQAQACGNIGTPLIEYCDMPTESFAVAEISSFQLETLNSLCPHIAVILNVTEDHLNRHYNMENYIFLKAKLLKNLTESEYAVLNYDDKTVRAFSEKTKAKIVYFSVRERIKGAYYENGNLYYLDEKILSVAELPSEGLHNVQNALAVIAAAKLVGVSSKDIAKALSSFKGIKHRIEKVATIDGVTYIDDSKGTNVDATIKAVETMKTDTVLLLGGKNKGYDYGTLFATLNLSKVKHAVLYGENRYALLKAARECSFDSVTICDEFSFAVRIAAMRAEVGQTVLLSPASASFDQFASYEERGDKFAEIVATLAKEKEENREAAEPEEETDETTDEGMDESIGEQLDERKDETAELFSNDGIFYSRTEETE